MNNISIRKATFTDFELIKGMMLKGLKEDPTAFSVNYEEYVNNGIDWWNSYISSYIFSSKDKMFLAFEGTQLVGMLGMAYDYKARRQHTVTLVWFYVDSAFRGKGIGTKLLEESLKDAQNMKMLKITILVNSLQEDAIKLYKKFGFEEHGRLVKELKIGDIFVDTLFLEKFLD